MTRFRLPVAAFGVACLVASCGGGDDGDASSDDASDATTAPAGDSGDNTAADDSSDGTSDDGADSGDDTAGDAADYPPGDVEYRVVNVLDVPVDIYTRTTGLVEAFSIEEGVQPGAITEFVAPPEGGVFLVTEAGAGDPTCVTTCDHFIAEVGSYFDEGPVRTIVLYEDEFNGPSYFDVWEQPTETSNVTNGMYPSDPAAGTVTVLGVGLTEADFGLRLGFDGTDGCSEPFNLENILVGGNQTPAFTYEGDSAEVVLFDNLDLECAEEVLGGPFTVEGGPGTRTLLVLTGSPGDMEAINVELTDDGGAGADPSGGGDETADADPADRALTVDLMADEMVTSLGLTEEQAKCASPFLVDAIGVDVLLDGDQLVDLDSLSSEYDAPASDALIEAVTACDIDPDQLGG